MKHKKIWNHVGVATLASAAILSGCTDDAPETHAHHDDVKKDTLNAAKAHTMPGHTMAGEGEGGEGEGASPAVDLATDDIAYLTQLGLMNGHLRVGYELYQSGNLEPAKTHMKHPEAELYADVVPAFKARKVAGFAKELSALANAVEQDQGKEAVTKAYQDVAQAIRANAAVVSAKSRTPSQELQLVSKLLRVAGDEYAIAVVDGKMQNAHEYQDAYGFTQIGIGIVNGIDAKDDTTKNAVAQAKSVLESLAPLWPGLIPPDTLETKASALYGAAARMELLSIGLAE